MVASGWHENGFEMNWPILIGLGVVGLIAGTQINRAIYAWTFAGPRLMGPWGGKPEGAPDRTLTHYLPVIGWWLRRDQGEWYGRAFWVRPLLIEASSALLLPAFYLFQTQGGLLEPDGPRVAQAVLNGWFVSHSILIGLMAIATFIDFDEKTIPDQVTIPGTLIALLIAWLFPLTALPYTEVVSTLPGGNSEPRVASLRFDFPGFDPLVAMMAGNGGFVGNPNANNLEDGPEIGPVWIMRGGPEWVFRNSGLTVAIGILWMWCFALVPKTIVFRYGFANLFKFMWASMLRPARTTKPKKKFKVQPRRSMPLSRILVVILVVATGLVFAAWLRGGPQWFALLSALIGLGFGGMTVWSVRILGSLAMQREAMGFGDVTLLAMIGAFLGWQASFLTFALAPFAAIFLAVGQYALTRRNELAFGPYLCLGAVILILSWRWLWNGWAGPSVFVMGTTLLWILVVSLVMLYVMLAAWRWIAYR